MRNRTAGGTSAQADGRSDRDHAIITDLEALIERVHVHFLSDASPSNEADGVDIDDREPVRSSSRA